MNARMGQPVSTLIDDLGFPSQQVNIAGRKAYVWSTSRRVNTLQQTTGFGGTPTLVTGPAVEYECEITVEVDQNDIMRDWSSEGNRGGCERYAKALR